MSNTNVACTNYVTRCNIKIHAHSHLITTYFHVIIHLYIFFSIKTYEDNYQIYVKYIQKCWLTPIAPCRGCLFTFIDVMKHMHTIPFISKCQTQMWPAVYTH